MSPRPVAPPEQQPDSFEFRPEVWAEAEKIIARYPAGRQQSAVMPLLDLAQRQHGWIPRAAIEVIAEKLGMPFIRAYEVATFYTMYNLAPVGEFHLQLCRTTPCWLRGADDLRRAIKDRTGLEHEGTSADGKFSLVEVECLGACCNAPMIQINDDFFEDLDYDRCVKLLDDLAAGREVTPGPSIDRKFSAPAEGRKTLLEQAGGNA